jgi:DNA-binding response OmpR family regulator
MPVPVPDGAPVVLVATADPGQALALRRALTRAGIGAVAAPDRACARVALMRRGAWAAAVLDGAGAGMRGADLAAELWAVGVDTPVLVLTAPGAPAGGPPGVSFLPAPAPPEALVAAVRAAIG